MASLKVQRNKENLFCHLNLMRGSHANRQFGCVPADAAGFRCACVVQCLPVPLKPLCSGGAGRALRRACPQLLFWTTTVSLG